MRIKHNMGFTLIELVVTVAILAILSRIAYPTYTSYVKRSNRSDAEAQLTRMGQAEERWFSTNDRYSSTTASVVAMGAVQYSPSNAQNNSTTKINYNLSPTSATSTIYLLTATPTTTSLNAKDGNLTLDNTGKKCWYKNGGTTCYDWTSN